MSSFHDRLVRITAELCEEYTTPSGKDYYRAVYADHLSEWEYKPLIVTKSRRGKKPLAENYYADVWAERQNKKIHVYEVWDMQNIDQAVTDIFFASLVRNIEFFYVVCTGDGIDTDKAKDLVELVLLSVRNKNGEYLLPFENATVTEIPDDIDRRRRNELKKYLSEELGFY